MYVSYYRAYSSAALYSLAGDFIVMNERAAFGLHGSLLRDAGTDPEEAADLARMRELDGAAYASRTLLPPEGPPGS